MTKEKPGRHRLERIAHKYGEIPGGQSYVRANFRSRRMERIAHDYAEKAFKWGNKVLDIEGNQLDKLDSPSVRRLLKNAIARRWYYEDLSNYTAMNQMEPSEAVRKKIWQDAKILAATVDKKRYGD